MSKFAISELSSTEELNGEDLMLISKKNEDGSYSSMSLPVSALMDTASDVLGNSGAGNGTTDTINLFLPTTAFEEIHSQFYLATGSVSVDVTADGYVGNVESGDDGKSAGSIFKWLNTSDSYSDIHCDVCNVGNEASGQDNIPVFKCYRWEKQEDGTFIKTSQYWQKADVGSEAFNTYIKHITKTDNKIKSNKIQSTIQQYVDQYYVTVNDIIIADSPSWEHKSTTEKWSYSDVGSEMFEKYTKKDSSYTRMHKTTVEGLTGLLNELASRLIPQTNIAITYNTKSSTTPIKDKAQNAIVYSQELEIDEDSAIYIYGSFTCDTTTDAGQSYYVEIQMLCNSENVTGIPDSDKNWHTIFRKYSETQNANNRTSFAYQLYAKAGVKIRGMIAPNGKAGYIYYNLSDFNYTRCKLNGKFNEVTQKPLQIPISNNKSQSYNLGENAIVEFKGNFSYASGCANNKLDRTTNLYYVRVKDGKYQNMFAQQLTTKNVQYSTYKFFMNKDDTVMLMMASAKSGNNAFYPPYGPNTSVMEITNVNYDQAMVDALATNGTKLVYRIDNTTDSTLRKYTEKDKSVKWYMTNGMSHTSNTSDRIGLSKIGYDENYHPEQDNENTTGAGLWVKWPNNIYEMADGATSLYNCTGNPKTECIGTFEVDIQNNLTSFCVSSEKNKNGARTTANNLVEVKEFGTSVAQLDPFCFNRCSRLTAVTSNTSDIQTIGNYAFSDCTRLTSDIVFENATSIGDYAFNNCYKIPTVNIKNAHAIPPYAFYCCSCLTSVSADSATTIGKCSFSGTNYKYAAPITTVNFPSAVTIDESAFQNNRTLTNLTIDNVETIQKNAFNGCTLLNIVNIANATTIYNNAFYGCKNITKVKANKLSLIYNGAFNTSIDCEFDFTKITIPPTLKNANAFPSANYKNWKVYVKDKATLEVYEASPIWKTFNTKNKKGEYTRQHIFVKATA